MSSHHKRARRKGDWHCTTCNFPIYGHKDKCKTCGKRRPSSSSSPSGAATKRKRHADWHCTTCNFPIHGHKDSCWKCRARRPGIGSAEGTGGEGSGAGGGTGGGGAVRDTSRDWHCTTCNFPIYGYKDKCGKCSKTRVEAEVEAAEQAARASEYRERLAKAEQERADAEVATKRSRDAAAVTRRAMASGRGIDPSKDTEVTDGESDTRACIICCAKHKGVTFYPCGHLCACRGCANKILNDGLKCPICMQNIDSGIEVFDA